MGSSTEGHISHALSARMNSRPMGWCRKGADSLSHIRIYRKNGGDMLELVQRQKEKDTEEIQEENKYFSQVKSCHGKRNTAKQTENI